MGRDGGLERYRNGARLLRNHQRISLGEKEITRNDTNPTRGSEEEMKKAHSTWGGADAHSEKKGDGFIRSIRHPTLGVQHLVGQRRG